MIGSKSLDFFDDLIEDLDNRIHSNPNLMNSLKMKSAERASKSRIKITEQTVLSSQPIINKHFSKTRSYSEDHSKFQAFTGLFEAETITNESDFTIESNSLNNVTIFKEITRRNISDIRKNDVHFETPWPSLCTKMFPKLRKPSTYKRYTNKNYWQNKLDYILTSIAYCIFLPNLWIFPIHMFNSGGLGYVGLVFVLIYVFSGPLMIMENALGQFTSKSCLKSFECNPMFSGVGWSALILAFSFSIQILALTSWSVTSIYSPFDLTVIEQKCYRIAGNVSQIHMACISQIIWNEYVLRNIPEKPLLPDVKIVASFLFIIIILTGISLLRNRHYAKINYVAVPLLFIIVILLLFVLYFWKDTHIDIRLYFRTNLQKVLQPTIVYRALCDVFSLINFSMGGMIMISSHKRFNDSLFQDVFVILFVTYIFHLLFGFFYFALINRIMSSLNEPLEYFINHLENLPAFFVLPIIALDNSYPLVFFYMLCITIIGILNLSVLFKTILQAICELNPICLNKLIMKTILASCLSIVFLILSVILISPYLIEASKDFFYEHLFTTQLILSLFEIMDITYFYGIRYFKHDLEMMINESVGLVQVLSLTILCPLILTLILVVHLIQIFQTFTITRLIYLVISLLLAACPICISIIINILCHRTANLHFTSEFNENPEWGPLQKDHWIGSPVYSMKLLKNKDNPKFLKTLLENEDIAKYVNIIYEVHDDFKYFDIISSHDTNEKANTI